MKLSDTVEPAPEETYKERLKEEYHQTKQRYEKLKAYNTQIEAASMIVDYREKLDGVKMPQHNCPAGLLREQQRIMGEYLHILELRAVFENIKL